MTPVMTMQGFTFAVVHACQAERSVLFITRYMIQSIQKSTWRVMADQKAKCIHHPQASHHKWTK